MFQSILNRIARIRKLLMCEEVVVYLLVLPEHHQIFLAYFIDELCGIFKTFLEQRFELIFISIVTVDVNPFHRFQIYIFCTQLIRYFIIPFFKHIGIYTHILVFAPSLKIRQSLQTFLKTVVYFNKMHLCRWRDSDPMRTQFRRHDQLEYGVVLPIGVVFEYFGAVVFFGVFQVDVGEDLEVGDCVGSWGRQHEHLYFFGVSLFNGDYLVAEVDWK